MQKVKMNALVGLANKEEKRAIEVNGSHSKAVKTITQKKFLLTTLLLMAIIMSSCSSNKRYSDSLNEYQELLAGEYYLFQAGNLALLIDSTMNIAKEQGINMSKDSMLTAITGKFYMAVATYTLTVYKGDDDKAKPATFRIVDSVNSFTIPFTPFTEDEEENKKIFEANTAIMDKNTERFKKFLIDFE